MAERSREPRRRAAGAAVLETEESPREHKCTCCDPRNPLVLRPDLGLLPDGSAEYALCVLHEPEPEVYRNRGDGLYVIMDGLSLGPTGDLLDEDGAVVARVRGDGFQRLSTIDDDDEPPPAGEGGGGEAAPGSDADRHSRPRTMHVDLTEDDFYR